MSIIALVLVSSITINPVGCPKGAHGYPVSYCTGQNGEKWSELGKMCHADQHLRQGAVCLCDASGSEMGSPGASCAIPRGFEKVWRQP